MIQEIELNGIILSITLTKYKTEFPGFHALSAEQKKQLFGKKGNRASSLQELQQRYMDKMADLKGNRPDGRKNKKGKLSKVEKKKMMREAKKKLAKVIFNALWIGTRSQI